MTLRALCRGFNPIPVRSKWTPFRLRVAVIKCIKICIYLYRVLCARKVRCSTCFVAEYTHSMALTWLLLACLVNVGLSSHVTTTAHGAGSSAKGAIDSKRRHDVVDEAFMEQKDILLDMLESKLKEMRDKKKKKLDRSENGNAEGTKCETLPSNVDLKLKATGLAAIGEADIALKFGNGGKGTLNLDANGISNVGKARLDLGVGDGSIYIPGLNNLFVGKSLLNNCDKQNDTDNNMMATKTQNFGNEMLDFRRNENDLHSSNSTLNEVKKKENEDRKINEHNSSTIDDNIKASNVTTAVELSTAVNTSVAPDSNSTKV